MRCTQLNAEDGPWEVFAGLRRLAGTGFWGTLLDCFYCLSLWISAPFAGLLGNTWKERGLLWLAFSAGAILLERISAERATRSATYWEEPEVHDGLLREGERAVNDAQDRGA